MFFQVALDGPSGAGKSTIAKAVAQALNLLYIDTGAMYRAVGLFMIRHGVNPNDEATVGTYLDQVDVMLQNGEEGQRVFLNSEEVTSAIRQPEISKAASDVSAIPAVRLKMVELQRQIAGKCNVIMDGRDIGSYVLPDAQLKIFLCASVEDRAMRRFEELNIKKIPCTYEEVLEDMKVRDHNDSTRAFAPLKKVEDAVLVDTTGNTFEQSYAILYKLIKEKMSHAV